MELITQLLGSQAELVVKVVTVLFFVNAGLSALSLFLEKIKDKTTTDVDNQAAGVVSKIASVLGSVVDFLSANRQH